jgi:hypothetical protein
MVVTHQGGVISRMHSGGSVKSAGVPAIHIYPLKDKASIVRDMASKEGQKVIFDVVKGRRIDLGIP